MTNHAFYGSSIAACTRVVATATHNNRLHSTPPDTADLAGLLILINRVTFGRIGCCRGARLWILRANLGESRRQNKGTKTRISL